MANIKTRQDDGSGGSPAAFWTVGAGTLTTGGGRLRQQTAAGGAEGYSDTPRGGTDSWAVGDYVQARIYGTGNDRSTRIGVRADNETKFFEFGYDTTGTFGTNGAPAAFLYDYTAATARYNAAYDATNHAYMRLERTATGFDFFTSPTGLAGSWTLRASFAVTISSDVLSAYLDVRHNTTQVTEEFDDFQVTPTGGGGGGASSAIPLLLRAGRLGGR